MTDKTKKPFYQSDMLHCNNEKCKLKDKCYRYWLASKATGIVSVYRPQDNLDRDTCEYYLNIKNYIV